MKELMKGPNERGWEDFENAISDDLETQNFPIFHFGHRHHENTENDAKKPK
jgi:hypothetical protein